MTRTREINRHLQPLRQYIEQLGSATINELPGTFRPVLHVLSLIWIHCPQYDTVKMVVLLRQICNDIISQVHANVDMSSIWTEELDKCCEKLRIAIRVCNEFKVLFFQYQDKVNERCPERMWNFHKTNVFSRFDSFRERLHDLLEIARNIEEFTFLERIDIGGTQGEMFTIMVKDIYTEFVAQQQKIQTVEYDALDLSSLQFSKDYRYFRKNVEDFDKRLCYILAKGFQNAPSASASFKLLETFETQIRREKIRNEVESKYAKLLNLYDRDLTAVFHMFNKHKHDPPQLNNLPRMSSTLAWCRAMLERITWPMEKFRRLMHDLSIENDDHLSVSNSGATNINAVQLIRLQIANDKDIDRVTKKHNLLSNALKDFESLVYDEWVETIESQSQEKLDDFLLKRLPDSRLMVNFDTMLSSCVQEVKYLKHLDMQVPSSASNIFHKRDHFRKHISDLELITRQYNIIVQTVIDVERPLIETRLAGIDHIINLALNHLNWNNDEQAHSFIADAAVSVSDLYNRLNFLKGNVKTIEKMIDSWMELSKVITTQQATRKSTTGPNRLISLVAFWRKVNQDLEKSANSERSLVNRVYTQWSSKTSITVSNPTDVIHQGLSIHKIVETSRKKIEADQDSQAWTTYVSFLNNLVMQGLLRSSRHCMQYLIDSFAKVDSVDRLGEPSTAGFNVLLRAKLELYNGEALFNPDIDSQNFDDYRTVQGTVNAWIDRIFNISRNIPRLDNAEDFENELQQDGNLQLKKSQLIELTSRTVSKLIQLKNTYTIYKNLWEEDPTEILQRFVSVQSTDYSPEDFDEDDIDDERLGTQLSLDDFENQIRDYERIYDEIQAYPEIACFGWIAVDTQPIRTATLSLAATWRGTFLDHLLKELDASINSSENFLMTMTDGILQEVPKGDYPKLVEVMGNLVSIQERPEFKMDESVFSPLRDILQLLRKHNVKVPQSIMTKLDELPNKWKILTKHVFDVKDNLSAPQSEQIKKISGEEIEFNRRVEEYRKEFNQKAPFNYDIGPSRAYEMLDEMHVELSSMEELLRELRAKQKLFQLLLNQGQVIKDCRSDLKSLKVCLHISVYGPHVITMKLTFTHLNNPRIRDIDRLFGILWRL